MIDTFIKLVSFFKIFYTSAGVDFDQFIIILRVKLMMDNRRNASGLMRGIKIQKENNTVFATTLVMMVLVGVFLSFLIFIASNELISLSIFHGVIMFIVSLMLISDFSSTLLDTTDNMVIMPRPVSSRTFFAARMTHIILYVLALVYAISAVSIFVVGFRFGLLSGILNIIVLPFTALFTIVLTSSFYLLIMRFSSEEKLRGMINSFQIVMMILVTGGTQILPHLDFMGAETILDANFELKWVHTLIPPIWMGAAIDTLSHFTFEKYHLILTGLCFVIPTLSFFLINKYFSNFFSSKLTNLAADSGGKNPIPNGDVNSVFKPSKGLVGYLAQWLTQKGEERSAFYLVWHQLGRERKLKMKLYPQIAYALVLVFIFLFAEFRDNSKTFSEHVAVLREGDFYLFFVYYINIILPVAISLIPFGDDFKAAWVYSALPIRKPGSLIIGSIKAIVLKIYAPMFLILSGIIIFIWGIKVIDDLMLVYLNSMVFTILAAKWDKNHLPFSEEPAMQQQGGNIALVMLSGILLIFFGGIHYVLVTYIPVLVIPIALIMAISLYFLIKDYREMSWRNFESIDL